MNTRLALAVAISAAALTACDQSAPKPKAAAGAAPTGGGPRVATGQVAAERPTDATRGGTTSTSSAAGGAAPNAPATSAPATSPSTTNPPAATQPPAATPADAPKDGVLKHTETDSGLIIDDLKFGTGAEAKPHQTVTIHYRGTLPDGTEFDSSYKTGKPAAFPLDNLIKGWQEGIPGMKIGGKRRLIVPPELGYGKKEIKGPNGQVLIPANSMLIFEIELFAAQ